MHGMESEHASGPVLDPEWAPGQAGVITLLHNIIIAGDDHSKAWFTQYLKCMQQRVSMYVCTCVCMYVCTYIHTNKQTYHA